jgi:hypothetical protein
MSVPQDPPDERPGDGPSNETPPPLPVQTRAGASAVKPGEIALDKPESAAAAGTD